MARTETMFESWTAFEPRNWRLVLVVFLVKMWRLKAEPRLIVPPGRTRNRFFALLLVFILGMTITVPGTAPFLYDCRWQHFVALGCLLSLVMQRNRVRRHRCAPMMKRCKFCCRCCCSCSHRCSLRLRRPSHATEAVRRSGRLSATPKSGRV